MSKEVLPKLKQLSFRERKWALEAETRVDDSRMEREEGSTSWEVWASLKALEGSGFLGPADLEQTSLLWSTLQRDRASHHLGYVHTWRVMALTTSHLLALG